MPQISRFRLAETDVNLRPDPAEEGAMMPVGIPSTLMASTSMRPLAASPAGSVLLAGGTQAAMAGSPLAPAELPGEALCAAFTREGEAVVMTPREPVTFHADGSAPTYHGPDMTHGLHLAALPAGDVALQVQAVRFHEPYTRWEGALAARDAESLRSALLEAYSHAARSAASLGRWLQPVALRWKLLDGTGRVTFTGPVTILSPQGGWQGATAAVMAVHRALDGSFPLASAFTGALHTFRLALTLPGAGGRPEGAGEVRALALYAAPAVHPVDYDAAAPYRLEGGEAEDDAQLRAYLPGLSVGMQPSTEAPMRKLMALAAAMDACEERVAVVEAPFEGAAREVVLEAPCQAVTSTFSVRSLCSRVKSILEAEALKSVSPQQALTAALSQPHSFAAAVTARAGRFTAWADLTLVRFQGYDAEALTVGSRAAESQQRLPVRASLRVTLTDPFTGRTLRLVRTGLCSGATATLSPVISYPEAAASLLEVRMELAGGDVAEGVFPLEPTPDGRSARWCADSPLPVELALSSGSQGFVPFEGDGAMADVRLEGAVAVAPVERPLEVCGAVVAGGEPLTAMAPCGSGLLLFGAGGVKRLDISAAGVPGAPAMVDVRRAATAASVAVTPGAVTWVTAAGSLVTLASGSKLTTLLEGLTDIRELAYCPLHDELWLIRRTDLLALGMTSGHLSLRTLAGVESALSCAHRIVARQGTALISSAEQQPAQAVEVKHTCELPPLPLKAQSRRITVAALLAGEAEDVEITILDTYGAPLGMLRAGGTFARPVVWNLLGPRRLKRRAELRGHVRPAFRIRSLSAL